MLYVFVRILLQLLNQVEQYVLSDQMADMVVMSETKVKSKDEDNGLKFYLKKIRK
jgi:hypothetical protein